MITVDDRGGSLGLDGARRRVRDLHERGADAELGRLEFGDYGFAGNGPNGSTVMVGLELKRTSDLLNSLRSKRLEGHQLPGMDTMYDQPWLLTEGIWREGPDATFEHYQGHWSTASLNNRPMKMRTVHAWVQTVLAPFPKVRYMHCSTARDTALFVDTLHRWWTEKEYEEHRAGQVVYLPPPDHAQFSKPSSFVMGLVAMVEGLGWAKAHAIEKAFADPHFGALTAENLQSIDGIGPTLSKRILEVIR